MYARNGASANANWTGEFNDNFDICVVPNSTASAIFGTGQPLTISAWRLVRTTGNEAYAMWATYANLNPGTAGTTTGAWVLKNPLSHEMIYQHSAGYGAVVNSGDNTVVETYEHIVYTIGNGNWRVYVNGVLQATDTANVTNGASAVSFTLGGHYPTGHDQETDNYGEGAPFRGRVGDLRVYPSVLNATQITDLFNAGRQSY